jgi:hypothetical protein
LRAERWIDVAPDCFVPNLLLFSPFVPCEPWTKGGAWPAGGFRKTRASARLEDSQIDPRTGQLLMPGVFCTQSMLAEAIRWIDFAMTSRVVFERVDECEHSRMDDAQHLAKSKRRTKCGRNGRLQAVLLPHATQICLDCVEKLAIEVHSTIARELENES